MSGEVSRDATFSVKIDNVGTTSADLTGGTPDDATDNVFIGFFASSNATLDGGDTFLGDFNVGTFFPTINAGGSQQVNIGNSFTLPIGSGSSFIIGKIDSNNVLTETSEINNFKVLDIQTPHVQFTGNGANNNGKQRVASVDPSVGFLDGNSVNYNGGQILANMTDAQDGEFLQIFRNGRGQDKVRAAGSQLKIGRRVVGTVTGNKTASLTIDFNADVDQVDVQRVLRSIGYKVVTDSPGTRNFTFQMKDPTTGTLSNLASKNVNIFFA